MVRVFSEDYTNSKRVTICTNEMYVNNKKEISATCVVERSLSQRKIYVNECSVSALIRALRNMNSRAFRGSIATERNELSSQSIL